ncbi:translocation/assembly module TamB domain-containing protein [Devosia sp.]|uniref:translocation/assembly module TamB domain-containing protein n=1 Tax=Devosia sp. TaxID=1871048 RepID=UPI003A8D9B47
MRKIFALVVVGAGLGLAVPLVAQDQMSPEEQKDWFVQFVEGQLSTPERQIRISNIDGVLSDTASIREVTISDSEGVWLRINNAAIDWDQGALFTGRLLVRELTADSIEFIRNAIPSTDPDLPAPEAQPFEVPEFPVAIQLDKLAVPKVTFGDAVFGLGSEISVAGNLKLENGSLNSTLDITRLDGPGGKLDARVAYVNEESSIDVAVTLTEPPDGIVANLLSIEGRPEIALSVTGKGPVEDLRTTLALDAGGNRALEGVATFTGTDEGLAVNADLGGPIGMLVAPDFRAFFGQNSSLSASAVVRDSGGVEVSKFTLGGGQLNLDGQLRTTSDGFLDRLRLTGTIADQTGNAVVVLPVPGGKTSIESADIAVDFGSNDQGRWTADITASGFTNGDLAARDITVTASGVAANIEDPANRRLTFNADGTIAGISSADPAITKALGDSAGFGVAGLWNAGEPIQLAQLRLVGRALTLAAAGTIDDNIFDGDITIETSSIAPFSGLADRQLGGAMSLTATGTLSPLVGGFNLALDGTATNLKLSEPVLDRVLAGQVALSGRVARDTQGLTASDFRIGNDKVAITADGSFATGAADFDFGMNLSSLSLISDNANGRLEITGSAKGKGDIALNLTGRVPEGQLAGKQLRDARFGFDGTLAEAGTLTGKLNGNADLGNTPVTLTGDLATSDTGNRLSGLAFTAGATRLTGDLVQNTDGLITGELALVSSDVSTAAALAAITASGSADARITLSASNGTQAAAVTGNIQNLRANDVRVGTADIRATLTDLFGTPAITGNVTARTLIAGGFTIDQLDAEANQSGGTTSFTVNASTQSDATLLNAGLSPLQATARGRLTGRMITLDSLTANGRGGLQVTGSGQVPLDGGGLAIDISGSAPLAFANRFVADRGGQFSGTANLRARVTGSLADPRFTGTVSTGGAGYVDPELNLRLVGIGGTASLNGDRLVIDQLAANLSTGGSVSIGGSVGLTGGNVADLSIRLNNARYADGNMFVATASGNLQLSGAIANNPLLSGNLRIDKADITIPESFGGAAALIDTQHRNTPAGAAATLARARVDEQGRLRNASGRPSVVQLNVNVSAPNQIFVRGRGLDAEVGGQVKLTGSVNDIRPVGGFTLTRGRMAILGQRITFEEGLVTLVGDLDPFLDFRARTQGDGITVFVDVTGRVSDLEISFSSNPTLPEDEVLSRLIFDRSMGELTPLQLAKLAGAAAELAGGSSTSLVDSLRDKAGLADLDIVAGEDGNLAVQAGAYVQDNVYLGVQAGADGDSRVTVNLDLTDDIKARASTGTDGETELGIFYELDY